MTKIDSLLFNIQRSSVADSHHLEADLDPAFDFDADSDPDPTFYSDAYPDPYPASQNDADPDPQHALQRCTRKS